MADTIRDTFFENKAIGALWDVAVSIKRGNPLPLDSNSVFASYKDLQTYSLGVLAYPGQIVAVVEENATGIYYLDQNLNINEVGKIPTGDNKSVEVENELISLHDFEKAFYKYVAEEDENPAHYERVEVSEENPWMAGLEPKVVSENGQLVLGWYEPNPTTIEGVNAQVTTIQSTVNDLVDLVGAEATDEEPATGIFNDIAEINTVLEDIYTKSETDTAIANAVASAGHLKREIVESLPEVEKANEDTIYMIKATDVEGKDNYEEYMLIAGAFAKIGDTSVDLTDYAKSADVSAEIEQAIIDFATVDDVNSAITNALASYATKEVVNSEFATRDEQIALLATKEELNTAIGQAPSYNEENEAYEGGSGIYNNVYTKEEVASLIADITGGESAADVLASLNAYKSTTDARLSLLEAKEDFVLQVATTEVLGGVKASADADKINVDENGIMEVNSLHVSKLIQDEGEWLILDGGDSILS